MKNRNMSRRQIEAAVCFAAFCEGMGLGRARDIVHIALREICNNYGEQAREQAAIEMLEYVANYGED